MLAPAFAQGGEQVEPAAGALQHDFERLGCQSCVLYHLDNDHIMAQRHARRAVFAPYVNKMMVTLLVMEAVQEGRLKLDQRILISEDIWRGGGAPSGLETMFASVRKDYSVQELIAGLVVASGSDAALALMLTLYENESAALAAMRDRAAQLTLANSVFVDILGVDETNRTDALDVARIVRALYVAQQQLPDALQGVFTQSDVTFSKVTQRNKNTLLFRTVTDLEAEAVPFPDLVGYGVYSRRRSELAQYVIGFKNGVGAQVLVALNTPKEQAVKRRKVFAFSLLDRILSNVGQSYAYTVLFRRGDVLSELKTSYCAPSSVPAIAARDVQILLPQDYRQDDLSVSLVTRRPLVGPFDTGAGVGRAIIRYGGAEVLDFPLESGAPCQDTGTLGRVKAGIGSLFSHLIAPEQAIDGELWP